MKTFVREDILSAEITGTYNFNEAKSIFSELMQLCSSQNKQKLLLDVRPMEGVISFFDRFNLANIFQDYIDRYIKMVILIKQNPAYREKIFETVANNRGVFIRVVYDEEEAIRFLKDIDLRTAEHG